MEISRREDSGRLSLFFFFSFFTFFLHFEPRAFERNRISARATGLIRRRSNEGIFEFINLSICQFSRAFWNNFPNDLNSTLLVGIN